MNEKMTVQWFPGHMAKTRRIIKENLKLVDGVCEIVDARVPESSRNPELDKLIERKPRIVLLNKADLKDTEWFFQHLDAASKAHQVDFVLSVSEDAENMPEFIKPYFI